jgi:hypothetical protein
MPPPNRDPKIRHKIHSFGATLSRKRLCTVRDETEKGQTRTEKAKSSPRTFCYPSVLVALVLRPSLRTSGQAEELATMHFVYLLRFLGILTNNLY